MFLVLLGLWMVQQQPASVPRYDITGTVTNAITGEPIYHALVQLSGPVSASALTGPDGRFQFASIPEGPINLEPQKPGFFAHGPGLAMNPLNFRVASGSTDFGLKLMPQARIKGRVTDENDEGIGQIPVAVMSQTINNGRKQWQTHGAAMTDDDGDFESMDLLPGRYVLFAAGRGINDFDVNGRGLVFAPVYYPNASDVTSAQVIDLQAGQEFEADFRMRAQRGYRVSGTITGMPSRQGGLGFFITNRYGQNMSLALDIDQKSGRWTEKAVPPGDWMLQVQANDNGVQYNGRLDITVGDSDLNNVEIVMHPGVSIPVTINHTAEKPFVNATLAPADDGGQHYGLVSQGAPPGTFFQFQNVQEGRYRLDVPPNPAECLDSAWYGNVDISRNELVVNGGGGQPITINMRGDCAVLMPKIEGSGQVIVVSDDAPASPRIIGRPGIGLKLSPGKYHVYAFTNIDDLEYANPEALRDYPSEEIEVDANQKLELSLKPVERKGN